ncbi:hypothetical protein CLCR_01018 [Cladophialophora carrionii]|uniref:Uncharacterized protein n=1 Tax=Cladophialophora carrionii TaxID=86049 RepID=A0A1C1D0W0_9EURO|nr:hypothetical protein CLCR_01018 [Cladophialophora carrionii]
MENRNSTRSVSSSLAKRANLEFTVCSPRMPITEPVVSRPVASILGDPDLTVDNTSGRSMMAGALSVLLSHMLLQM